MKNITLFITFLQALGHFVRVQNDAIYVHLDKIFGGAPAKYVAKMDINGIILDPHKMVQSLQKRYK